MRNSTRNTKNSICAIELAVPAIPPKPKTAAIKAITKNVNAQLNMIHLPFLLKIRLVHVATSAIATNATVPSRLQSRGTVTKLFTN
jgi:hypothetical protein